MNLRMICVHTLKERLKTKKWENFSLREEGLKKMVEFSTRGGGAHWALDHRQFHQVGFWSDFSLKIGPVFDILILLSLA